MRKGKTRKAGVRRTRTRAEQKKAKARNALKEPARKRERIRRWLMSRAGDLKEVEGQIEKIEADIEQSTKDFRTYNDEVTATIRAIMEEAGVWDEVHGLEQERAEAQQRLQSKIQRLQGELAAKRSIKEFLAGRESRDKRRAENGDDDKADDADVETPEEESDEKPNKKGDKKDRPKPPA